MQQCCHTVELRPGGRGLYPPEKEAALSDPLNPVMRLRMEEADEAPPPRGPDEDIKRSLQDQDHQPVYTPHRYL